MEAKRGILFPVMHMEKSIWDKSVCLPSFPSLDGDEKTDVLIIGCGMAGILCAHARREARVDCLVLDAEWIGGGDGKFHCQDHLPAWADLP